MFQPSLRRQRLHSFLFALAFLTGTWPACVSATGLTLYSDRTSWANVTSDRQDIPFTGLAPVNGFQFVATPPGINISGVNFNIDHTANNGSLYVTGPGIYYNNNYALSSQSSSNAQNILVTLPPGVISLGLDFGDLAGSSGNPVNFTLSTGQTFTRFTTGYGGAGSTRWFAFAGLTSDLPISTLLISRPGGGQINIDNFSFGFAAVPEPSAAGLLGLGIATFISARCLRRKRHSRPH